MMQQILEQEIWKDIPGYEGHYQASNLGNIKSIKFGKEKTLSPGIKKNGYIHYILVKNGIRKTSLCHRLIMLAFIGFSDLDINHIDGNPKNNKLENLEYCTKSENQLHRYNQLGKKGGFQTNHYNKGKFGKDNIKSKKIGQYDINGCFLREIKGIRNIARELGISHSSIIGCCKGKQKNPGGFIWKYII